MLTAVDGELQNILLNAALHIAGAIAVLLIGRWLAGIIRGLTRRAVRRTKATPSITEISERVAFYGTLLVSFLIALVILGVSPTALVGFVGIIAIVAAVALRESLRDVAATVIFVVFQPFAPGDLIETNGMVGMAQEILMFNTVLTTQDNRKLIIPNGNIQNNNLINYSALDKIRLDLKVRLGYADDLSKAKETLLEIANADARVCANRRHGWM